MGPGFDPVTDKGHASSPDPHGITGPESPAVKNDHGSTGSAPNGRWGPPGNGQ
jgi:hypothetical protein